MFHLKNTKFGFYVTIIFDSYLNALLEEIEFTGVRIFFRDRLQMYYQYPMCITGSLDRRILYLENGWIFVLNVYPCNCFTQSIIMLYLVKHIVVIIVSESCHLHIWLD